MIASIQNRYLLSAQLKKPSVHSDSTVFECIYKRNITNGTRYCTNHQVAIIQHGLELENNKLVCICNNIENRTRFVLISVNQLSMVVTIYFYDCLVFFRINFVHLLCIQTWLRHNECIRWIQFIGWCRLIPMFWIFSAILSIDNREWILETIKYANATGHAIVLICALFSQERQL